MLSAAVHPAAIEAGIAAGADLYSGKPFSRRSLAAQIRNLLDAPDADPVTAGKPDAVVTAARGAYPSRQGFSRAASPG